MPMNNKDYWKARMQVLEDEQYQHSRQYYDDMQKQFRRAAANIRRDIDLWYERLAENNDVSYAEAKKLLKAGELEEFKWSVEDYIKAGRENAIDERWMKELENASARFHISYLEAMKLQIQQHAEVLSAQFEKGMGEYLHEEYAGQFYRTAFEISKGTGVSFNLARLDERRIDMLIKKPWAQDGKIFSDRIWANKEKLVTNLHTELTQCIVRGESPRIAAERLAKKMNVSKVQAGTLIMTEAAAIASASQKECFKELGMEQYEFDATLDGSTCETCQGMDTKVFPMAQFEVGVTAPPVHPRCRCCVLPHFDDWEEFGISVERAARNPGIDEMVYVDGKLSYPEWRAQYLGVLQNPESKKDLYKRSVVESNIENVVGSAIMKLTLEEVGALQRYKSFESYMINESLRGEAGAEGLSQEQKQFVEKLDSALSKMPKYEGDLIRTVDFADWSNCSERTKDFIEVFVPGKKIKIGQYWSTSKQEGYNEQAGIKIYIQDARNGRDISSVGLDEQEVLYERNSTFIVVAKVLNEGVWNILLREI